MHILHIFFILSFCYATLADNSCIFQHPTKGVIDLTSIGLRNGQPRFRDLSSGLSPYYTYSYNPCYSFMENNCQNAAVCQISSDQVYSFALAVQNQSTWSIDSDTPVLTYKYGLKTVSISMVCSSDGQDDFEVLDENPTNYYLMRLRSPCACWNGCKTPEPTTAEPATPSWTYSSACMYHDSRYGTIDLSSIGSNSGTPTFKDMSSIPANNFVWSYNPCYKFSEHSCQNVSGCQIDKTRGISYTIGLQDHAYWINMNNTNKTVGSIVYPSALPNRRLTVDLICNPTISSHRLGVVGETSLGEYKMQLTSPCACWNGCTKPAPEPDDQPIDWYFWIVTGGIGGAIFLLFCILMSCLFCSKPNRPRYPVMLIDEKTPFINSQINEKQPFMNSHVNEKPPFINSHVNEKPAFVNEKTNYQA